MDTAARMFGFGVGLEKPIHIYDVGHSLRSTVGLRVHQREGAPLVRIADRLASAPSWTALEMARACRRRPPLLAVLDAAVRSGRCTQEELVAAARDQAGRRGIVAVREILSYVDGRSESPMESEARMVMIDGGVAPPELQYEVRDADGRLWRLDFAWPDALVAAEYDSVEWHASREGMLRDKMRTARLQQCGWTVIPITVDDVRRDPVGLAARIGHHLRVARKAG